MSLTITAGDRRGGSGRAGAGAHARRSGGRQRWSACSLALPSSVHLAVRCSVHVVLAVRSDRTSSRPAVRGSRAGSSRARAACRRWRSRSLAFPASMNLAVRGREDVMLAVRPDGAARRPAVGSRGARGTGAGGRTGGRTDTTGREGGEPSDSSVSPAGEPKLQ